MVKGGFFVQLLKNFIFPLIYSSLPQGNNGQLNLKLQCIGLVTLSRLINAELKCFKNVGGQGVTASFLDWFS